MHMHNFGQKYEKAIKVSGLRTSITTVSIHLCSMPGEKIQTKYLNQARAQLLIVLSHTSVVNSLLRYRIFLHFCSKMKSKMVLMGMHNSFAPSGYLS